MNDKNTQDQNESLYTKEELTEILQSLDINEDSDATVNIDQVLDAWKKVERKKLFN